MHTLQCGKVHWMVWGVHKLNQGMLGIRWKIYCVQEKYEREKKESLQATIIGCFRIGFKFLRSLWGSSYPYVCFQVTRGHVEL